MALTRQIARWCMLGTGLIACALVFVSTNQTVVVKAKPSFVTIQKGHFMVDDQPFRFIGVNVDALAARTSTDGQDCNETFSEKEVDRVFQEVSNLGVTVVRFWAFQSFTNGGRDFSRFDYFVDRASAYDLRLIPVLENQEKYCTEGGAKKGEWYETGNLQVDGLHALSYREYATKIVERYKDEPIILSWELMNGAESANGRGQSDYTSLLEFALMTSRKLKTIDHHHPIAVGVAGPEHPGTEDILYLAFAYMESVDIITAQSYNDPTAFPESFRICGMAAERTGKPCILSGLGFHADAFPPEKRADIIDRQLMFFRRTAIDGIVLSTYRRTKGGVEMNFDRQDFLADVIKRNTPIPPSIVIELPKKISP